MIRVVIVYDISNNKRRAKVSTYLEAYGSRVNRSVFECLFSSSKKLEILKVALKEMVDKKTDSIRVYILCLTCIEKSESLCDTLQPFEKKSIFFF